KDYPTDSGTLRRKAMVLFMLGKKEDALKVLKDEMLPWFQKQDNLVLYKGKKLNTANAQIETIYRILKIGGDLIDATTKKDYVLQIEELKKRKTKSFADIDDYLKKIKDMTAV
ncbi:MAG: hypothetical protein V1647_04300, partial [Pseudomonadota bacterium]